MGRVGFKKKNHERERESRQILHTQTLRLSSSSSFSLLFLLLFVSSYFLFFSVTYIENASQHKQLSLHLDSEQQVNKSLRVSLLTGENTGKLFLHRYGSRWKKTSCCIETETTKNLDAHRNRNIRALFELHRKKSFLLVRLEFFFCIDNQ